MRLVLCLFLDSLASYSAPLLFSNNAYLNFSSASGISNMFFNSTISFLRANTSLSAADNAMYSASVADMIFVCRILTCTIGNPTKLATRHVLVLMDL